MAFVLKGIVSCGTQTRNSTETRRDNENIFLILIVSAVKDMSCEYYAAVKIIEKRNIVN